MLFAKPRHLTNFLAAAKMTTKELIVQPLGSGREVGRSCHLLKFRGKIIMLDCGIHVSSFFPSSFFFSRVLLLTNYCTSPESAGWTPSPISILWT